MDIFMDSMRRQAAVLHHDSSSEYLGTSGLDTRLPISKTWSRPIQPLEERRNGYIERFRDQREFADSECVLGSTRVQSTTEGRLRNSCPEGQFHLHNPDPGHLSANFIGDGIHHGLRRQACTHGRRVRQLCPAGSHY